MSHYNFPLSFVCHVEVNGIEKNYHVSCIVPKRNLFTCSTPNGCAMDPQESFCPLDVELVSVKCDGVEVENMDSTTTDYIQQIAFGIAHEDVDSLLASSKVFNY